MSRWIRDPAVLALAACAALSLVGVGLLAARGPQPVAAAHGRPGVATTTTRPDRPTATGPLVGQDFPGFAGISLLDGRAISAPAEGSVVLVTWTPECDCTAMFSAVNAAMVSGPVGVYWLGVVTDGDVQSAAQRAFDGGHLFPSSLDSTGEVAGFVGNGATPSVLVIKDGKVQAELGPDVTSEEILAELRDGQ